MSRKHRLNPPVRATVEKIVTNPPVGEGYVVAFPREDYGALRKSDSVTFSLSKWHGGGQSLSHGLVVDLYGVTLFQQGWRAALARPVVPTSSEQRM